MPPEHVRHAEREVEKLGLDVAEWRALYSRWVAWGAGSWDDPD